MYLSLYSPLLAMARAVKEGQLFLHVPCQKHKIDCFMRGFMITPAKRL